MSDKDRARREREWTAQERALREERAGAPASRDTRIAEYRTIARALRVPPLAPVPADFAKRTAALAEESTAALGAESTAAQARLDERLEARLQAALLASLALAGVVGTVMLGGRWLPASIRAAAGPVASGLGPLVSWGGALAVCVALSLLAERCFRRADLPGKPR